MRIYRRVPLTIVLALLPCAALAGPVSPPQQEGAGRMSHRWLFIYNDMSDPAQVDRDLALFPRAQAAGYNGVVFKADVAPSRVDALKAAAQQYGLALVPLVMEGSRDQNNTEGVPARDALFIAHGDAASFVPDNPTKLSGGDFENVVGNRFPDWTFQENEGVGTFADHDVVHGGSTAVRMENLAAARHGNCRLSQQVKLQPFRQYHISIWAKTQDLRAGQVGLEVNAPDTDESISYQTFRVRPTQDWTRYDIGFNSLAHTDVSFFLGVWAGKSGRIWWDDLVIEEIGLVNVLRRPGCPVTVRGATGAIYEEGADFEQIADPELHIWRAYHQPPAIHLTPGTCIKEGERLRVTYYHSVIIYNDKLSWCLTEPAIFDEWRQQVKLANDRFHPPAFFMYHDEIRVANWCQSCRSKHMTSGQLLAENVRRAAAIVREIRPDAELWDWNDTFDPMVNAKDPYYLCNGGMKGSWEGLDRGIGIVNWATGLKGENCRFFADEGEQQILAGYYDYDEDGSSIAEWIKNTQAVPNIVGAMYTTWEDKYSAMETWAHRAWGDPAAK